MNFKNEEIYMDAYQSIIEHLKNKLSHLDGDIEKENGSLKLVVYENKIQLDYNGFSPSLEKKILLALQSQ